MLISTPLIARISINYISDCTILYTTVHTRPTCPTPNSTTELNPITPTPNPYLHARVSITSTTTHYIPVWPY